MYTVNMEIDALLIEVKRYQPDADTRKIRDAYEFAKAAHKGQKRESGESYFTHPFSVAKILAEYKAPEDTIIAALLHDVVEDTPHSYLELEKRFGEHVAYLVDGVTKLPGEFSTTEKIFTYAANDKAVILIKLADRLHNMRTLHFIKDRCRREKFAEETMEIYVPVAKFLLLKDMATEMERLCKDQ